MYPIRTIAARPRITECFVIEVVGSAPERTGYIGEYLQLVPTLAQAHRYNSLAEAQQDAQLIPQRFDPTVVRLLESPSAAQQLQHSQESN
jgi:hypothetical protein